MGNDVQREMPKYKCHKVVSALQIGHIDVRTDGSAMISPVDGGYAPFEVDGVYVDKHRPLSGGYYVVYDDGYKSYSPAEVFEAGYTRME